MAKKKVRSGRTPKPGAARSRKSGPAKAKGGKKPPERASSRGPRTTGGSEAQPFSARGPVTPPIKRRSVEAKAHALLSAGADKPLVPVKQVERARVVHRKLADRERKNRTQEYDKAVAELSGVTTMGFAARSRAPQLPLRIYAEGDSWFDFPFGGKPFRKGDVIAKLAEKIPYPILNDAVRGEEVRQMLGVTQRQRLVERLTDQKRNFNVVLFSGGGNDLVGDPFCLWIRPKSATDGKPASAVDETAFAHALGVVRAGYEQLIDIRDRIIEREQGRRIAVFIHAYDLAIPSGQGVCGFGPWLLPALKLQGWDGATEGKEILRIVMRKFDAMLQDIAFRRADVHHVKTQGTLGEGEWNDELHPTGPGFAKIADCFAASLRSVFPGAFT